LSRKKYCKADFAPQIPFHAKHSMNLTGENFVFNNENVKSLSSLTSSIARLEQLNKFLF